MIYLTNVFFLLSTEHDDISFVSLVLQHGNHDQWFFMTSFLVDHDLQPWQVDPLPNLGQWQDLQGSWQVGAEHSLQILAWKDTFHDATENGTFLYHFSKIFSIYLIRVSIQTVPYSIINIASTDRHAIVCTRQCTVGMPQYGEVR